MKSNFDQTLFGEYECQEFALRCMAFKGHRRTMAMDDLHDKVPKIRTIFLFVHIWGNFKKTSSFRFNRNLEHYK